MANVDLAPAIGAAERLDRLPISRWLKGVMAVLFLGWLLESYDIGLIGSVLPSLTHEYALGSLAKSAVATSSTVGIVVGIVPAGLLADRFGRKQVLIWGTITYSVLTFATGLAPNIGAILVLRLLAGLAMGAVFPIPYAYGSELCPPHLRGRFTGFADSFLSVGYFLSPFLAAFLIPSASNTTGWRTMFMLGGLPVAFAALTWKYLPESPRWYEARGKLAKSDAVLVEIERRVEREVGPLPTPSNGKTSAPADRLSLRQLFRRPYLRRSSVLWVAFGGTFFIFYAIQVFMPTVVQGMGFSLTSAFTFTAIIVGLSIPGKLLEAWAVERYGRRPVIIVFTLVAAAAAVVFGFVHGALPVLLIGGLMSLFGIGVDPAVKVYTAESYPTEVRASGTAATEGFGRLISGIVGPALVPPLLAAGGVVAAFGLVAGVALVAVVVVACLGHETGHRPLEQAVEALSHDCPSAVRDAVCEAGP